MVSHSLPLSPEALACKSFQLVLLTFLHVCGVPQLDFSALTSHCGREGRRPSLYVFSTSALSCAASCPVSFHPTSGKIGNWALHCSSEVRTLQNVVVGVNHHQRPFAAVLAGFLGVSSCLLSWACVFPHAPRTLRSCSRQALVLLGGIG